MARFAAFFIAHLLASLAALVWASGVSLARFDGAEVHWLSRSLAEPLYQLLWFPGSLLLERLHLPGWWGYLPIAANSLLWAGLLVIVYAKLATAWKALRAGR